MSGLFVTIILFATSCEISFGWLIGIVIVEAIVLGSVCYNKGEESGKRQTEGKLTGEQNRRQRELDQRDNELGNKKTKLERAEFSLVRREKVMEQQLQEMSRREQKCRGVLQEAIDQTTKKDDELKELIHFVTSAHPDNQYIAGVLNDAEAILIDKEVCDILGRKAPCTAAKMRQRFNESCRQDRFEARFYKYQVALYEYLVPKLSEYAESIEEAESDAVKTEESDWLSEEEYQKLDDEGRSQLALDRYVKSQKKSKWQVGRDYELYIGYLYRCDGWEVEQKGIRDGLNDLGRDLICRKGNDVLIVQCKYWSHDKIIHEKHVAQLYGTTVAYKIDHDARFENGQMFLFDGYNQVNVNAVFVTSTDLSAQAKEFAKTLGVTLRLNEAIGDFPRIKCNVGSRGEKIFHLPFDQQYDTTVVSPERGDCYAMTVREAVENGFRRAKRHIYAE